MAYRGHILHRAIFAQHWGGDSLREFGDAGRIGRPRVISIVALPLSTEREKMRRAEVNVMGFR